MKLKEFARESKDTYKGDKAGIPIVGLEHLVPNEIIFNDYDTDTENTFTKCFKAGQVLFGRRRAYLKKAAISTFDGICSGDITVIEAIPGKVDSQLLPFIIQNDRFFDYAVSRSAGGLSPRVKWNDLADYEIDLPSLDEQHILADKLWAAYRLKESYKKLLEASREMVKSQFIEMVGNVEFRNNKFRTVKGKQVFEFASGKANTKANLSDSYPYFCYGGNGVTGKSKEYLLENATIVIGRVGEYCGCVHRSKPKSWITDNAIYLKAYNKDLYEVEFLYYLFTYINFHNMMLKGGQPKISQKPLQNFEYSAPPKDIQRQFIEIAQQADKSEHYN